MSEVLANPRKRVQLKDLHAYVEPNVYQIVHNLTKEVKITKTDYVSELVIRDLKERGKL